MNCFATKYCLHTLDCENILNAEMPLQSSKKFFEQFNCRYDIVFSSTSKSSSCSTSSSSSSSSNSGSSSSGSSIFSWNQFLYDSSYRITKSKKIKKIDDDWVEYTKDYTKIKFNPDDNLPLNKPLKFYNMTVTIRCVISEENKLYPQVFSDEALHSL